MWVDASPTWFPHCAWQKAEKTQSRISTAKGIIKKASLTNGTFGLLAISVYDNKPVHIMSTRHKDSAIMEEREQKMVRKWQRDCA